MSSSRKCTGRLFHTRGPAAAKLLSANMLYVRVTAHDLSVDEWSRRLGPSKTKCMSTVNETCQLEVDTSVDRKPVQMMQNRRDVVPSSSSSKPSGSILDGLNVADEAVRQWIAVVQLTWYECLDECSDCFVCQLSEHWTELAQVVETRATKGHHMCWQWELRINNNTKDACWLGDSNRCWLNRDVSEATHSWHSVQATTTTTALSNIHRWKSVMNV